MPIAATTSRGNGVGRRIGRNMTAALRQRGSPTVWLSEAAIAGWKAEGRTTPGGQPQYSALAILTALFLPAVFRLALRQTEGVADRPSLLSRYSLAEAGEYL
jgi:hypothetical protein